MRFAGDEGIFFHGSFTIFTSPMASSIAGATSILKGFFAH